MIILLACTSDAHEHIDGGFMIDPTLVEEENGRNAEQQHTHPQPPSHTHSPPHSHASTPPVAAAGHLVCSQCGHSFGSLSQLIVKRSPEALRLHYITLPGASSSIPTHPSAAHSSVDSSATTTYPVQTFKNPGGHIFDLLCMRDSPNDGGINAQSFVQHPRSFAEATWFKGYSWSIIGCGKCGKHVGWRYDLQQIPTASLSTSTSDSENNPLPSFYGLIVSELRVKSLENLMGPDGPSIVTLAALNQTVAVASAEGGEVK